MMSQKIFLKQSIRSLQCALTAYNSMESAKSEKRLTASLAADVMGYSRILG